MRDKNIFRFKQFSIEHGPSTMKVGTDGVLLGAWVDVGDAQRILDIGTGSGLIALMLAQRTSPEVTIDGVEISAMDALQAEKNFLRSPWKERLAIHHTPIQEFAPLEKYDLIVSNPPYFINSLRPEEAMREQARHTTTLSHTDLLKATQRLLKPGGRTGVILPLQEGLLFKNTVTANGLCCIRETAFRSKEGKAIERLLLEFSFNNLPPKQDSLTLYDENSNWSNEYRELTKAFYLRA